MVKQLKRIISILLVLIIFQQLTLSASIPLFRGQVYAETDTEAPTAPTNLIYEDLFYHSVTLTWEPSTDNVGVTEYDIYEDATVIESVYETSCTVTGLTPNTEYTFSVKAKDGAGNESDASNIVNIKTSLEAAIEVDGNILDWENIDPIAIGSGKISSLSAAQDDNKLYILLEGTEITETYYIFIDSDNNSQTGYSAYWIWPNMGAEYLIVDNELFEYTGSGDDWSFDYVCDVEIAKNANVKEKSVNLMQIGKTEAGVMKIACSAKENDIDLAPVEGSDMAIADIFITGYIEGVPENISISATETCITVEWDAVEGATGYDIEVDGGEVVDNGNSTTYEHNGLTENTEHIYRVRAKDENGERQWSSIIIGKTLLEAAIEVDGNILDWENIDPIAIGSGKISSLSAAQDDNKLYILLEGTEITETYDIFIDSDNNSQTGYSAYWIWPNMGAEYLIVDNELFEYTGSGDDWSFDYVCDVEIAKNANVKEKSVDLTQIGRTEAGVMKLGCAASENELDLVPVEGSDMAIADIFITGDTEAPTAPTNLTYEDLFYHSVTLTWEPSTDNVGVTEYDIYEDATVIESVYETSCTVTGLTPNTEYTFSVKAKDEAGNESDSSNTINITTESVNRDVSIAVEGGEDFSIALKEDGTVWTWGENWAGQLGDGTNTTRLTPVQVIGLTEVTEIANGDYHGIALKEDGTVWSWGFNYDGQLGDGTTEYRSSPVQVSNLTGIVSVRAGKYHGIALKEDGTVWTWGYNGYGQLGDDTAYKRLTPIQVPGLIGVVEIGAGKYHSVVLKSDGTVWAWGYNDYGQLCNDTITSSSEPIQVLGISDVVSIESGDYHCLVLKSNGTVWGWGYNGYGQIGDGTNTDRFIPTQVIGLTEVKVIAGGNYHNIALKEDGTVWTWGQNWDGQIGDGSTTNRIEPVEITGITGVKSIATGRYHSIAIKEDGTVWAWGDNDLGQLGDGTTLDHSIPTQIEGFYLLLDTEAPTAPTNLTYEDLSYHSVTLTWEPSTDNIGVTEYDIYEGTTVVESVYETSCTVTGLTPNMEYTFSVKAKDGAGNESDASNTINITTLVEQTLAVPQNINTVPTSTSINITLDAVDGATGYEIEVDGNVTDVGNNTSYIHDGLQPNSSYVYRLRAVNANGAGEWSEPVIAMTLLGVVNNVTAISNSSTSINITWDAVDGATGYEIEVDGNVIDVGNDTSYTHDGLLSNSIHSYRLRAKNTNGAGEWSESISQYTLVGSPTNVNAVVNGSNITVSWDAVNGATGYDIEINGELTENVTNPYMHSGIEVAIEYTYKVRAKNANGVGEWSIPVTAEKSGIIKELNCESGQTFEMFLTASNIQDFGQYTFTLEYDPNQIEIIDLCIFTPAKETNVGVIGDTGIEIIEYNLETGTIKYTLNKGIDSNKTWTGIVNGVKFRSKTNEQISVQHTFK